MTVEELLAKQEITELLYTYARAMDRLDDDLVRSVWHEGGTVQYLARPVQSLDDFLAFSTPNRRRLAGHTHVITNVLIRVVGDVAYSESYGVSFLGFPPSDGTVVTDLYLGRYEDRWSRRNGRWGIDHRQYVSDNYLRQRLPEEWSRGVVPAISRRDAGDPSYALFEGQKLEDIVALDGAGI